MEWKEQYKADLFGLEVPEKAEIESKPVNEVKEPESTAKKVIKIVVTILCILGALPLIGFLILIAMCGGFGG